MFAKRKPCPPPPLSMSLSKEPPPLSPVQESSLPGSPLGSPPLSLTENPSLGSPGPAKLVAQAVVENVSADYGNEPQDDDADETEGTPVVVQCSAIPSPAQARQQHGWYISHFDKDIPELQS